MKKKHIHGFSGQLKYYFYLLFYSYDFSESIYGSQLNCVEKQLKDLFRTCHELQLTYLMVFEKHFIFDLTEREERDILIEGKMISKNRFTHLIIKTNSYVIYNK